MEGTCQEQVYLGKVTQVIDPSNFWMQIGTDESLAEFLQFEINLEDSCRTMGISIESVEDIEMGQLVLVDCTDTDRMWRRGQVSRVDRDSEAVDVLYLDYGDTELVNIDRLCINQKDFFSFPSQALRCCLAGIKPIAKSWTSRATKVFQDMVANDIFQTVVLAFQPASFRVSLYTNHGDDGIAVSHMMLEQELGLPSDDEVPRLFVDAPKHFNPDTSCTTGDYSVWGTPVTGEECKEEGAWPDSAPDQSVSSDSPPSASYTTPQTEGDNTDTEFGESIQNYNSKAEDVGKKESHTPGESIPDFDFTQIEKYWDTSTDKLREKRQIKRHNELEAENLKLKEDMQEQSSLTAAAGTGRFTILTYSSDEEDDSPMYNGKFVDSKFISDVYNTSTNNVTEDNERQDKENKPQPIVVKGKKEKWKAHQVPPRFQKNSADNLSTKIACPPPPPGFSERCVKTDSEEVYPNTLEYTAVHWSSAGDQGALKAGETVSKFQDSQSDHKRNPVLVPLKLGVSDQVSASWVEDVEILGNSDGEIVQMDKIAELEQTSPTKVDFYSVVNQIFAGVYKEDYDVTAAKLRRLFSTDLFVYLDTDQLQGVINILLNRAVRHYGDLHDCLLEIIELLNVAQDFPKCIVSGIKKLHDMYIKVTMKGRQFHVQCSKIFGHLFSLSLFWNDSGSCVQKCLLDLVERWMYFNKKGTQTGQEDLEQVYLYSFTTIWVIIGDILKDRFVDRCENIQWECRDKLLGADIPRATKEQLLDLYINCFIVPSEKFTIAAECQTDSKHQKHVGSQTDPQQPSSTEPLHTGRQSPRASQSESVNSISLMTPSSFTASEMSKSRLTGVTSPLQATRVTSPAKPLSQHSSPVRTTKGVTSPSCSSAHTPLSHMSGDSSAYFTPDESSFSAEFLPLDQCVPGFIDMKEKMATSRLNLISSHSDVEPQPRKDADKVQIDFSSWTDSQAVHRSPEQSFSTVEQNEKTRSEIESSHQNANVSSLKCQTNAFTTDKNEQPKKIDLKQQNKVRAIKGQDTAKLKRKEGHKKGSFPLMRYGLATSVQNTHQPAGQIDITEDTAEVGSDPQKKLDMNSIMMDFMSSSDNTCKSTVTSETKSMQDSRKSDKKYSTKSKPKDWWSMDVNGSDSDSGEPVVIARDGKSSTNNTITAGASQLSGNSTAQEDDGDIEWETDNSDNEDDDALVAAILKKDAGNSRPRVKQPIKHEQPCWRPGVRKCTACGEDSHTIYDCLHKHKNAFF